MKMSEQALSEARNKIKWEAFAELSERISDFAYTGDYTLWNGYRVSAIDGSKQALPNDPKLARKFGRDKGSPMGRGSVLYDVINYTVIDGQLEPLSIDERELAKRHLQQLIKKARGHKELIIFDRGYPSEDLIEFCKANGLFYLMRVRRKFNLDVDKQYASDGYVWIGKCRVRVIKVILDDGEIETLLTNLVENFDFKELYYLRWGVEKEFDVLKNVLEIENFSGRTETAIRQDFYIHIIASNFLAAAYWEAQETVDEERNADTGNKYKYKVNIAQAAGTMRDYLVPAILADDPDKRAQLFEEMRRTMADAVILIRPDRKVPRRPNNRKAKFHHNRKSNL